MSRTLREIRASAEKDFEFDALKRDIRELKTQVKEQGKLLEKILQNLNTSKSEWKEVKKLLMGNPSQFTSNSQEPFLQKRQRLLACGIGEIQYDPSWTWPQKIIYAIAWENRPLVAKEVGTVMGIIDPTIWLSTASSVNTLYVYLSRTVKQGRLHRFTYATSRGGYYALPQWLDDSGNLKREYFDKILL